MAVKGEKSENDHTVVLTISIVESLEPQEKHKGLLQEIAKRATHFEGVEIEWDESGPSPTLRIKYPSLAVLEAVYDSKTQLLAKALEDIQTHKYQLDKIFKAAFAKGTTITSTAPADGDKLARIPYLTLKYTIPQKHSLIKYYNYANIVGGYLNSQFYVEEVADGFVIFYQRREDYLTHQLDRMDANQVAAWFEERGVDLDDSSIQELLDLSKQTKQTAVQKKIYKEK